MSWRACKLWGMSTTATAREIEDFTRVAALPRTLPPAILTGPSELWRFLDDVAAIQDRRRVEAARRPLVVIPPRRGADLGPTSPVYVRTSFPRQLPGNRPDVRHPRWPEGKRDSDRVTISVGTDARVFDEAAFQLVHQGSPPSNPEGSVGRAERNRPASVISYDLGEGDSAAREATHDAWVSTLDPEETSEPFVDLLDPSHGDGPGDRYLAERGFTRTGRPESNATRGAERRPVEEAARRARIHCADLDRHYRDHRRDSCSVTLEALRAPYRPRPGQPDPFMDARRAVAACLRLEGFKTGTIALVLDRDPSRIEELTRGVGPFYRPVKDNWTNRGEEDGRASAMRWRREQSGIADEVRRLYTNRPIDIRTEVSKTRRKKLAQQERNRRLGPSIEAAVRRRLNGQIPANRDRRDLSGHT